ncbi:hypothetical protein X744_19315 [Mesorhizobium sp. LNJC372A00]|nr:hypothetical protein X744_19315 [Mesorhizobium sp. LNJC372A00]
MPPAAPQKLVVFVISPGTAIYFLRKQAEDEEQGRQFHK